jgi:uncharacterized membrane protein YhaH (DUF805 family)
MSDIIKRAASTLFSFSGTISRKQYVLIALFAVLIKHVLDANLAWYAFHQSWTPLNYVLPLGVPITLQALNLTDIKYVLAMVALSTPFAWVGLAITTKRFRTIGWPLWLVTLFFVPVANIASFGLAAAWSERNGPRAAIAWNRPIGPRDSLGAAIAGIVGALVVGMLLALLGTRVLDAYGWGLFAGVPFVQGAFAVVIFNSYERRTLAQNVGVALLSVLLTGAAMLAVAFEGAICILMATPLALFFALLGALFAHAITRRSVPSTTSMFMLVAMVPILMGADVHATANAPLHEVETSLVIDALPTAVWSHVIDFPDLPAPTELIFRVGVSYPERARIVGRGAGAVRYCEFSTGDFVEPITAWQPGKQLAFNVVKNPEPMREWSPYGHIDTPHLHDYLVSQRGEFLLEPLTGGRTRLVGRTWYRHHLWPDEYWTLWSDSIIHEIHARVLVHIKNLSERPVR